MQCSMGANKKMKKFLEKYDHEIHAIAEFNKSVVIEPCRKEYK